MKYLLLAAICFLTYAFPALAQHQMPDKGQAADSAQMSGMDMSSHLSGAAGKTKPVMSHTLSRQLPMSMNGSGTSWSPADAPVYMHMLHSGHWMYMLEGNFFIRYNHQDIGQKGRRGDEQWDAPDMLMFMGQRSTGKHGLFHFNTMFSLDALFTGERGYPLLYQTGESADSMALVDRQHPHDLFSELSLSYAYSTSKKSDIYLYAAYPGEPALGPQTFMHRASGIDIPDAPLSHHWMDATHISFGVVTGGLRYGRFKIEGSSFTGREPDENRYNFDQPRLDSRSVRLWYNPSDDWSLQVSHGFIKSPEMLHPSEDIYRTTASVSYSKRMGTEQFFNATAVWGMNEEKELSSEQALLAEAAWRLDRTVLYARYEHVQKSVEEMNLEIAVYGEGTLFALNEYTLGAGFDLLHHAPVRIMIGAQGSLYHSEAILNLLYGNNPLAGEVYLRFYPGLMRMSTGG